MPFLIPFFIGASATGYFWYNSKKEQEQKPTFQQEVVKILMPIVAFILVLLILRWLYLQGSKNTLKTPQS